MRSDRVIATAWDATFTLFDGNPGAADIERLERNVPLQAGRISAKELSLSRANRSVRLFEYVVKEVGSGRQPERSRLEQTGYLMRTTAVYGTGKFGAADRSILVGRPSTSTFSSRNALCLADPSVHNRSCRSFGCRARSAGSEA